MEKNKVIVLSRVSTQGQDLEQQTESVMRQIKADGLDAAQVITIEDKESAVKLSEEERNGLNDLKAEIAKGGVTAVYAYEISRISRRMEVNISIRNYLRDNKIQLVILKPHMQVFDQDWNVSAEANVLYSIFAALSENEGYLRKERMARGKAKAKAQGRFIGGQIAYGYVNVGKRLAIDQAKAEIVRRVFREYVSGKDGSHAIANRLYNEGYLTQTDGKARQNTVLYMLDNPAYKGDQTHEAIVSEDLWNAAAKRRRESLEATRAGRCTATFLAGKLIETPNGATLYPRKRVQVYWCPDSRGLSANIADTILLHAAAKSLGSHSEADRIAANEKLNDDLKACRRRLAMYDQRIAKETEAIQRIEERVVYGKLNEERAAAMETEIEKRIKQLKTEKTKDQELESDLTKTLFWMYQEQDRPDDVWSMNINEQAAIVQREIRRAVFDGASLIVQTKRGTEYLYELVGRKRKGDWCRCDGQPIGLDAIKFVRA